MWIAAKEVNSLSGMFWQTLEENEFFLLQQAKSLGGFVSSLLSGPSTSTFKKKKRQSDQIQIFFQ
jgi:hypothetical protein